MTSHTVNEVVCASVLVLLGAAGGCRGSGGDATAEADNEAAAVGSDGPEVGEGSEAAPAEERTKGDDRQRLQKPGATSPLAAMERVGKELQAVWAAGEHDGAQTKRMRALFQRAAEESEVSRDALEELDCRPKVCRVKMVFRDVPSGDRFRAAAMPALKQLEPAYQMIPVSVVAAPQEAPAGKRRGSFSDSRMDVEMMLAEQALVMEKLGAR